MRFMGSKSQDFCLLPDQLYALPPQAGRHSLQLGKLTNGHPPPRVIKALMMTRKKKKFPRVVTAPRAEHPGASSVARLAGAACSSQPCFVEATEKARDRLLAAHHQRHSRCKDGEVDDGEEEVDEEAKKKIASGRAGDEELLAEMRSAGAPAESMKTKRRSQCRQRRRAPGALLRLDEEQRQDRFASSASSSSSSSESSASSPPSNITSASPNDSGPTASKNLYVPSGNAMHHSTASNPLPATSGATNASSSNATPAAGSTAKAKPDLLAIDDLINLSGPLTEDLIIRTLQARFRAKENFINIGPVLLSLNSLEKVGNTLTLSSVQQETARSAHLLRVVQDAVRQQSETGYPQAIIFSGENGSGKTYSSMICLRHLFDLAGGGHETDAFKHLSAAFTVLRSLGSAKIASSSESSRIGHFIEVQVTDGALYRTKIHSYFLDQNRVVKPLQKEKNYHIFYQMLAGLTKEERVKLNLEGYSVHNLKFLNCGDVSQRDSEDAARFEAWKACLSVLGIPFMDVVRVLAAILLLGNISLNNGTENGSEPGLSSCEAKNPASAAASLLGVSRTTLIRGLTTRTVPMRGQLVTTVCDINTAMANRDSLAKALYCRTVATIVRRANTLKRIGSTCGTLSSDSNESVHNHVETGSHHASTVGSGGAKSHKSLNVLNSAVRHATDGFIGILDMFGFEDSGPSHLEQLCINLCAETMQHFYNTHIFKSSIESCRDEGVRPDIEVDYVDNVPCIDFISSLRTGLLSMLDVESSLRGNPETYVAKIKAQHRSNSRYFDVQPAVNGSAAGAAVAQYSNTPSAESRLFGIRHFAGNVVYDAANFLRANRDTVSDDVVAVFHKTSCTFGFATHLFGMQLKTLFSQDGSPRGLSFRISPTAHNDLTNGSMEPSSTLTQDFHTRLDNLLRTLVHARPHFIRCVKANNMEKANHFDRQVIIRQLRALQVLETVNLMAGGFPHRVRFRAFNSRYRCLAPFKKLKRTEEKVIEDCKAILECFVHVTRNLRAIATSASTAWAQGKRHIFLSEGARQQLEALRNAKRNSAATRVQSTWRGWHFRGVVWPAMKRSLAAQKVAARALVSSLQGPHAGSGSIPGGRPRPQPITGTPPPEVGDKVIQQTCTLFGLDLDHPPAIPPSRSYTVFAGSGGRCAKLSYPQTRIMKMDYPEDGNGCEQQLLKGEPVLVVGASSRRGHLLVEHNAIQLHVPYQYMELPAFSSKCSSNGAPAVTM